MGLCYGHPGVLYQSKFHHLDVRSIISCPDLLWSYCLIQIIKRFCVSIVVSPFILSYWIILNLYGTIQVFFWGGVGLHLGMGQNLLIPFLGGWTSIYQLFWCSPGVQGFDTLPFKYLTNQPSAVGVERVEPAGGWECSGKLVRCHLWRPGLRRDRVAGAGTLWIIRPGKEWS